MRAGPLPATKACADLRRLPSPTIPGRFSVPARRCRSCGPPKSSGTGGVPLPDVERTRALRAVELVAGDGQQVAAEGLDVDRHLAHGLYRIGVEVDVGLAGDNADLRHWLEDADLVVGHHHADELRVRSQCTAHVAGIDCARAVDGEEA